MHFHKITLVHNEAACVDAKKPFYNIMSPLTRVFVLFLFAHSQGPSRLESFEVTELDFSFLVIRE